ncbi:hypothetical protein GCM10009430_32500 [Aquimarina litoralis]|uniref:Uncharacterized protein n=1 Tax=Aquimarina litoralis TaxID=584605 RepID=A0ABN1J1R7_9FLAO
MSALYSILVKEMENKKIILDIKVIHPDSMVIPASPGFALSIIHSRAERNSPISEEVSLDLILNKNWMAKYARGFILDVDVEIENYPGDEMIRDYANQYWENVNNWLRGDMTVLVSDSEWLHHLQVGDKWETASFDPTEHYESCDPIISEDTSIKIQASTTYDIENGLMPMWKYMASGYALASESDIFEIPKYPVNSYITDPDGQPKDGQDIMDYVKDNIGEMFVSRNEIGVLMRKKGFQNDLVLLSCRSNSYGYGGALDLLEDLTKVVFNNKKKRLPEPLSYRKILQYSDPVIIGSNITGVSIEYSVLIFNREYPIELADKREAFNLLIRPFEDELRFPPDNGLPMMMTLKEVMVKDKLGGYVLDPNESIIDQFISDYEIIEMPDLKFPDLDSLSRKEVVQKFQFNAWPIVKIRITVCNPKLLEGYSSKIPFAYGF